MEGGSRGGGCAADPSNDRAGALRARLAERLADSGAVRSEAWRRAVERVPRHLLVPCFYIPEGEHPLRSYALVDAQRDTEEWLAMSYEPDESLIIEHDLRTGFPTSSATMPSVVLAMLEMLDVEPSHRVLEIGTGSGYSAALLCERLGSDRVTTIDVGERVAELARARLADAGYSPAVVTGDGLGGYPAGAPYDRIVSTCQAQRVPKAWVDQTRPGGVILASLPECLVRLTVGQDGSASGRVLEQRFGFMWARTRQAPEHASGAELMALVRGAGETRPTAFDPRTVLRAREVPALWSVVRLVAMPFSERFVAGDGLTGLVEMESLSWALIDKDRHRVTQGGGRRLWDLVEEFHRLLRRQGAPGRERLGLSVRPDGSQCLWLDDPAAGLVWEL